VPPCGEEHAIEAEPLLSESHRYTSVSDADFQNQQGSPYQKSLSPDLSTKEVLIEKDSSILLSMSGMVNDQRLESPSTSICLPVEELKASVGTASKKEEDKEALTVIDSSRDKLVQIQRQQDHESIRKESKKRSKLSSAQSSNWTRSCLQR
jgi:hypothetical protein